MGTTAKEDISTTKKELVSSKGIVFAPRAIQFAHQFIGGESSLNLLSLITPSLLAGNGFVNATSQEIAAANLSVFGKNLKISLSRGLELKPYIHYLIVNNNIVFIGALKDAGGALADEIMFGEIQMASGNAQIVGDVKFVRGTVEVAIGQTTVNLGERYKVNENSADQVGAVKITRNGLAIYRNIGNVVASPLADGNYQEVDSGNGYGVSIMLNVAPVGQSDIIEFEIGVQLSSGDLALWDSFQRLQGSVLALSQDAAQEFYGDQDYTRYLTVAPSDLERKAYGDSIITNRAASNLRISALESLQDLSPAVNIPQATWTVGANIWGDAASFLLPVGLWDLYFVTSVRHGASASTWYISILTVPGNSGTGFSGDAMSFQGSQADADSNLIFIQNNVAVTTPTVYYAKAYHNLAGGNLGGKFFARRIK